MVFLEFAVLIALIKKTARALICVALFSFNFLLIPQVAQASSQTAKRHNEPKLAPGFMGAEGSRWPNDFGITSGRCDREAISGAVAGAMGGALGSPMMRGDNHATALLVGKALSAALLEKIGKDLDLGDRACLGHSLELAKNKQNIVWTNGTSGIRYVFTPTKTFKEKTGACREYSLLALATAKKLKTIGRACRGDAGEWTVDDSSENSNGKSNAK